MNTLDLQRILAHLPDDMPVVEVSAPPRCAPCARLLIDDEIVAVRVCNIMVWARVGGEYLGLTSYRECARTMWDTEAPQTPAAFAAIVADVARRARVVDR